MKEEALRSPLKGLCTFITLIQREGVKGRCFRGSEASWPGKGTRGGDAVGEGSDGSFLSFIL